MNEDGDVGGAGGEKRLVEKRVGRWNCSSARGLAADVKRKWLNHQWLLPTSMHPPPHTHRGRQKQARKQSQQKGQKSHLRKSHCRDTSPSCSGYTAQRSLALLGCLRLIAHISVCVCVNVCLCDINRHVCRGSDFPRHWLCIST